MLVTIIAFVGLMNVTAPADSPVAWGAETFVAMSETKLVGESSGVVAARLSEDVYFTHNDSGSLKPIVWVFRLSKADRKREIARHLGSIELIGASNKDWEDIAVGPNGTIYVFDGGDNPPCKRTGKRIIRFAEPKIDPDGPPIALRLPCESIRFEYPDSADAAKPASRNEDRYDAECLFVHPVTADIYIVTKRNTAGRPIARVYKLPSKKGSDPFLSGASTVHVLQFVVELPSSMNMVTGGDIDRTGRRIVLRNYWSAYEYTLPTGKPFDEIFRTTPRVIPLIRQVAMMLQGEGVCYSADERELVMTTESPRGPEDEKFRVFVVPEARPQSQPASSRSR